MAQNEKGRRRANGLALTHKSKPLRSDTIEYITVADPYQGPIDAAAILAARARVALPTARLFAELHGIGGARHA